MSSKNQEWATPEKLFRGIEAVLQVEFSLDVCASRLNHKCDKYFTVVDNGLIQNWDSFNWCHPPANKVEPWIQKAISMSEQGKSTVMLLQSRTEKKWFRDLILFVPECSIAFLCGRAKFEMPSRGMSSPAKVSEANFGTILVGFGPVHDRMNRLNGYSVQSLCDFAVRSAR